MGEWMDKMLPEMKKTNKPVPPESELLSDESGHKYREINRTCQDCHAEYAARVYYFPNGFEWKTDRIGRCPDCRKKRADILEAQEKAKLKAENDAQRETWRKSSGIPKKNLFKGFQHFEQDWQPKAYARCIEYAQKFPLSHPQGYESLVLFSDHTWGSGKTHLACSIANNILSRWNGEIRHCPVRFISEPVLFKTIRDTYSYSLDEKAKLDSEKEIIDSLIQVPLLILDDLGKEEVTGPEICPENAFRHL